MARALVLVAVVLLGALPTQSEPDRATVALPNAGFERVVRPAPGAYGSCFADWLFAVRSGSYGLSAHEREGGSTCARITSRGKAGRADLMSKVFHLEPYTGVRVRAAGLRHGVTGVVALHPPYQRRHVDLALLDGPEDAWGPIDVTLRAGAAAGTYRVTFGVVGEGYMEIDEVRVDRLAAGSRAEGTVLILDLNVRSKDYESPEGWWIAKDIAAIWGYDVVVWNYREFTAERLERLAPAAIVLSPWSGQKAPSEGAAERAKARTDTYTILRKTSIPMLGICFGHQWLGRSKGVATFKEGERGDVVIQRIRKDPIFARLGATYPCSQSHRFALKRVPSGFLHLAQSKDCKVQVIKDKRRCVYGFQGHFERGWEGTTPHGRLILGNFFRLVER